MELQCEVPGAFRCRFNALLLDEVAEVLEFDREVDVLHHDGVGHGQDGRGEVEDPRDACVDQLVGHGLGRRIYDLRMGLIRATNRRGMVGGGLIPGYARVKSQLTVQEYVDRVVAGELRDPTLSFQLKMGFQVRGLIENYLEDSASDNWATLLEWPNPEYRPH